MSALALPHHAQPAARAAGLLYALIILTGLTAELALRAPLITADAAETTARIAAQTGLFRLSLLADLTMVLADIALGLVFFALFQTRAAKPALVAMVLRLMQAALIAVGLVMLSVVPSLTASGQADLVQLMTQLHANGYDIGLVLFGLNSLVMAHILHHHSPVPKLITAGIAASGLVYMAGGLARLVAPELTVLLQPAYLIPISAETALCLWLLITARL